MDLKLLSWNVEHFRGPRAGWLGLSNNEKDRAQAARVDRVVATLNTINPDIFAILEVEGDNSPYQLSAAMPDYSFLLTEGAQSQEILVGFRKDLRVFFTQKGEFKENNIYLRPAPVLNVLLPGGGVLDLLFGHFKSLPDPSGWGLRAAMFEKLWELKGGLDRYAQSRGAAHASFVAMGDLNTMGLSLSFSDGDMTALQELERFDRRLASRNMRRPAKSHATTFSNGSSGSLPDTDLDHVYLDGDMQILPEGGFDVQVGGWTKLPAGPQRDQWIADFSDHAPIWLTLTGL